MAGIWTYRLGSTKSVYGPGRDPGAMARTMDWNFRRDTPFIVAAALLSLRDAGLIRMFVKPSWNALDRVRIERTEVAASFPELPLVEGGLLMACEDLARKRFGKTSSPGAGALVREFTRSVGDDPSKWVAGLAVHNGRTLGLYAPEVKRGGFSKAFRKDRPVYVLERLAACEDQAVAFASRWQEFATAEPELEQRLIAEVTFAVQSRSSG